MRQPKHKRTVAQHAADIKFAAAGRAKQHKTREEAIAKTGKPPPLSRKRAAAAHQAGIKWAAAGRAAQARKRNHLKPLPKKKPALAGTAGGLHDQPVCAAVVIAEHLAAMTGVCAADTEILGLARVAAGGSLEDFLCAAVYNGPLGGVRLGGFWRCDEDLLVPGLVYGVQLRGGYHAVLAHPRGVISWGLLMPLMGVPCEAWHLEWEL